MNGYRTSGIAFGGLVALVAAVASYTHMRTLAAKHGEDWLSWLSPLSVDGLLVVASLAILRARRDGGRAPWLAWLAVVVGILVSLVANVAAAGPDLASRLVAAWPPLAFALAFELVMSLVRQVDASQTEAPGEEPPACREPHQEAGDAHQEPGENLVTSENPHQDVLPLHTRVADMLAEAEAAGQRPPGRVAIARQLDASEHEVRQVLAELRHAPPARLAVVRQDAR
ncbi:DUF2637 domain-containing protein [Amycolatopsis sp. NPDC052450]|uniref:DUF2637 domain-containing protein n=1 Tax=Amycolatopsis sp. NPDC052450 TaxID=3363937 RepID=UPI0037CA4FFF